ncbi:coiled-coil domain-containing protein 191 [Coccinella septempunctata]|uniref:coiled-coil domain-containing protein 191 n=1 Tax=Coccinella septempunctata TaxID=41139 RepID=UPI001D07FC81|nr:coiled-coil domain-containing protein 191 [Coccinella septempunctata]
MLAVAGKNSLIHKTETESPNSKGIGSSNVAPKCKNIDIGVNERIHQPASNNLSTREKVQRLIDCMKKRKETKPVSGKNEESSLKSRGASFQNRFSAQKKIIEMQRSRLMEQEKIINELKMGILSKDDIHKNDKYDISELFQDCRIKLLGKVPLEYIPKNQDLFVKTQTVPKIIQELEKRALERMQYREIIKERKKMLEETRKQLQEENLRKKHQMEEEERLRHLEMLNERHRKEQEKMKLRKINKEIFMKNMNRAVQFHDKKILIKIFYIWKYEYISSLSKLQMSEDYFKKKVLKKHFMILLELVHYKYSLKCVMADSFQRNKLLRRSFRSFKENRIEGIRSWQVAEDFNDFRIERTFFKCLYSFTSKEKILRDIKNQQANYHYRRKLLFYSFFHWKSLPIVLKMEKVKEERKQKWRKKVLEILPDFCPSEM